jgi:5-oxoprolinase (ATP-hydrolysing)
MPGSGDPRSWRLWVDTGGTFTDCLALTPTGELNRFKVLSSSALRGIVSAVGGPREVSIELPMVLPEGFFNGSELSIPGSPESVRIVRSAADGSMALSDPVDVAVGSACEVRTGEESPVLAARLATRTPAGVELPPMEMRLATTRATNALLERSGSPTALFITRGFGDLLEIGTQQRHELFALEIRKRRPFYSTVVEVDERLDAAGRVLRPLDEASLEQEARRLVDSGVTSAAVAMLHSYRNPSHEAAAREILLQSGFRHVSCSADLAPLIRLLPRAETTVVDAYLAAVIETYLTSVAGALRAGRLQVMTSAGGLQSATGFRPKESLLSGPAGGVVGAARAGSQSACQRVISFDMGGTSTDVARYDGEFDYQFETVVGEARILAPALAIETVAAGGGSICRFDGRQLKVGPESAGAAPGPACYGAGGPLTLTDVNLLLGRLDPEHFEIPLSPGDAEEALETLLGEMEECGAELGRDEVLRGLLSIANERMAEAIRRISVRKGYDPSEYTLVAFGGAGGQHAVALADLLGIGSVLVPTDASLLSAWGLGHALVERFVELQVLETADAYQERMAADLESLGRRAAAAVAEQGVPEDEIEVRRRLLSLRLVGQESTLEVEYEDEGSIGKLFDRAYAERFGYPSPDRQIEVESVRVIASSRAADLPRETPRRTGVESSRVTRRCLLDGEWVDVPLLERSELPQGEELEGPALVAERFSATVIETGWRCRVDSAGALLIRVGGAR